MTEPKQWGGRRHNQTGRTPKERPEGSSKRLLPLWATQEQWDWLLDNLPGDTTERTELIINLITKENGE
jgi:hypothetical protein